MFKQPDGFFFYIVYQANLIILSTPLAAKNKEVLQLCRNTIQSNGNGTVALSQFISAA